VKRARAENGVFSFFHGSIFSFSSPGIVIAEVKVKGNPSAKYKQQVRGFVCIQLGFVE